MSKKTGRNDPCPCGSGKKYKQCCEKLVKVHTFKVVGKTEKSMPSLFQRLVQSGNGTPSAEGGIKKSHEISVQEES